MQSGRRAGGVFPKEPGMSGRQKEGEADPPPSSSQGISIVTQISTLSLARLLSIEYSTLK